MITDKRCGFTLIEMMITIAVVSIGLIGVYVTLQQTMSLSKYLYNRLEAASLAQEGIEIIRNIRDTNYIQHQTATSTPWDEGLATGNYEVQYTDASKAAPLLYNCPGACNYDDLRFLKKEKNGFYNYDTGTPTKFKRRVYLENDGNLIKVYVYVYWRKTSPILVRENLYNWLPE